MKTDEFERQYAERSGITTEELRNLGRVVVKCECDYEGCEGWASLAKEIAEDYIKNLPGMYGYRWPLGDE